MSEHNHRPPVDLEHRLLIEETIAQVSALFTLPLGADLDQVCARIGKVVAVSRCGLLALSQGGLKGDLTHEWCAPGTSPLLLAYRGRPLDRFGKLIELLAQRENVVIEDVLALDDEQADVRQALTEDGLRSCVMAPVLISGKLVGILGILESNDARTWLPEEVRMLRIIGEMVGNEMARRRVEKDRERLLTRLFHADRMNTVGQLASGIAHEIQNPISFVLPNLRLLKSYLEVVTNYSHMWSSGAPRELIDNFRDENQLDTMIESLPQILGDCLDGVDRIREATRELRAFASLDEHQVEALDLSKLIETSLSLANNEIKYRAQLRKHLAALPQVVVSRGKMAQVFLNLLVYAASSIEEGRVDEHWIRITSGQLAEQVFVEIAHNGTAIPQEGLDRVFDPFGHLDGTPSSVGLGLSISQMIVKQHRGRIDVRSEPVEGTVFTVWLPLNTGMAEIAESEGQAESRVVSGRILIVDDEPPVLRMLARVLNNDHDTVDAQSGAEALAAIAGDGRWDVVLCDLMMHNMSGMELYERVEREHGHMADRFLFMTGGAFTPMAAAFVDKHSDRLIEKPIDAQRLLSAIQDILEKQGVQRDE